MNLSYSYRVTLNRMRDRFLNISYPSILQHEFVLDVWKKIFCEKGFHLFDEVASVDNHYLFCDACELTVHLAISQEMATRNYG